MLNWNPMITLLDLEKEAYRQAIVHHEGNFSAAMYDLGVHRSVFYRRVRKHFNAAELAAIRPNGAVWRKTKPIDSDKATFHVPDNVSSVFVRGGAADARDLPIVKVDLK